MIKEHVEFQTIHEDYSIYECENGQVLKAKQIIGDLIKEKDSKGNTFVDIGFKESSLVITTREIDTSNLEYMPRENVTKEHEVGELSFRIVKETINIYETANSIILLTPVMEKILITNKKDEHGEPILRYIMKNTISMLEKSSLKSPIPQKEAEKGG